MHFHEKGKQPPNGAGGKRNNNVGLYGWEHAKNPGRTGCRLGPAIGGDSGKDITEIQGADTNGKTDLLLGYAFMKNVSHTRCRHPGCF